MMTQTVTIQATGVNKSIYLSADTLRKISELPDGNNLSALVRRLIDNHYAAIATAAPAPQRKHRNARNTATLR